MSTEEKVKCPDCVPLPKNPRPIFLDVAMLLIFSLICYVWGVFLSNEIKDVEIDTALYFCFAGLFFSISVFISFSLYFTYRSIIGNYTYSYLDPEDQNSVHTHKSVIQDDGHFFHVKKTKTADSYTEQRVEIINPIFRLKCGGMFTKSGILSLSCEAVVDRWKIVDADNTSVLLGDTLSNSVQLRQSLKDALIFVRDYSSIDAAIDKAQRYCNGMAETMVALAELEQAIGERDFLGVCMMELCQDIIASKNKTKSPVGQAIREKMEKIIMLFSLDCEAVFKAWCEGKSVLAAANPTFAAFMKHLEEMNSSERTSKSPPVANAQ